MDESVRAAMERWPSVPALHGWLSLDAAGRWRVSGEPITHPGLVAFIGRNYECDEAGRWFFQNGPQRGYVRLEYTPWVLFVDGGGWLRTHTGVAVERVDDAAVDDEGNLLLRTALGVGRVHPDALGAVADWLTDANGPGDDATIEALARLQRGEPAHVRLRYGGAEVPVRFVRRTDVPAEFGFVADPRPGPEA